MAAHVIYTVSRFSHIRLGIKTTHGSLVADYEHYFHPMVHIAQVDEETALLAEHREGASRTPLPWRQLSIVLTMHMCEPMSSQIITPFLPQLIRDVGITGGDERKVGHYVGLMVNFDLFALCLKSKPRPSRSNRYSLSRRL